MENLKVLVLDKIILLTQIEEISGDLGTPD